MHPDGLAAPHKRYFISNVLEIHFWNKKVFEMVKKNDEQTDIAGNGIGVPLSDIKGTPNGDGTCTFTRKSDRQPLETWKDFSDGYYDEDLAIKAPKLVTKEQVTSPREYLENVIAMGKNAAMKVANAVGIAGTNTTTAVGDVGENIRGDANGIESLPYEGVVMTIGCGSAGAAFLAANENKETTKVETNTPADEGTKEGTEFSEASEKGSTSNTETATTSNNQTGDGSNGNNRETAGSAQPENGGAPAKNEN